PACGWYQNDMVLRSRKLLHRWITPVLWTVTPGAILFLLLAVVCTLGLITNPKNNSLEMVMWFWLAAFAFTSAVIFMIRWRKKRRERHDINQEDVEARKELGQKLAMKKEIFLQMVQNHSSGGPQEAIHQLSHADPRDISKEEQEN